MLTAVTVIVTVIAPLPVTASAVIVTLVSAVTVTAGRVLRMSVRLYR